MRWFRDGASPGALARDHGVSRATADRYVDEVLAVLADQAPDLAEALERAKDGGFAEAPTADHGADSLAASWYD